MNRFDVVIGLGSNLGERRSNLEAAVARLTTLGNVVALSAVYETAPLGPPQGDYLNMAIRIETPLEPSALLDALLGIERELGRQREPSARWGPRSIDLDVLWIRDVVVDAAGLRVPHPHLRERTFALLPLLDVAPDARDPAVGDAYADVLRRLDQSDARRLAESLRLPAESA